MKEKRDYINESKTGRISLWIISVFILVIGMVLVFFSLTHLPDEDIYNLLIPGGLGIVFGIIGIITLQRGKKAPVVNSEEVPSASTQEPLEEEPDEQIVVSPTHINESTGSIFVYRNKGILIYNGIQIPMDSISDVSFNNAAMAYLPEDYHILVNFKDGRVLHIPVGMDRTFAQEVAMDLRDICHV